MGGAWRITPCLTRWSWLTSASGLNVRAARCDVQTVAAPAFSSAFWMSQAHSRGRRRCDRNVKAAPEVDAARLVWKG
jgi:hypothetical protein